MYVDPDVFKNEVDSSNIFVNTMDSRIPQTIINSIISDHFYLNETGKVPMLLFVGYDGCLANALPLHKDYETSAIHKIRQTGGLYLGYAGGAQPGDQSTSTAAGWAATLTGVWGEQNGVKQNKDVLNEQTRSIIYDLGKNGIATSFSVIWEAHFKTTYKKEIASSKQNNYPIDYALLNNDIGTYEDMLFKINGTDYQAIFGIFEHTDSAGHGNGFTIKKKRYLNAFEEVENLTFNLISAVEERETYTQEDWLIIILTDHGGKFLLHGGTSIMESTVFFSINKPLLNDF